MWEKSALKSINFPWNPPLADLILFPSFLSIASNQILLLSALSDLPAKSGSNFRRKKFGNLLHIYLDFLKTSYASNYFWDSEYFWDIFIRYFLNFFYGPPLLPNQWWRKKDQLTIPQTPSPQNAEDRRKKGDGDDGDGKNPKNPNPKQKPQPQHQRGKWERERRTTEKERGEPSASFPIRKERCS